MKYPHLAAQLFNVPLLAAPDTADAFARAFVQVLGGEPQGRIVLNVSADTDAAARPAPDAFAAGRAAARYRDKKYIVTDAGVGILPVYGVLAQRAGQITPDCAEMASYEKLGRTFDAMVADSDVKAILLEIDSPGGQVAGNFELARRVLSARDVKPVWAHANEMALSGGYSLAAAAQQAYVPDTGYLGSIGVVMLHMSQAERDAKQGYQYTAIYAGARKVDGNSHEPLSSEAKARFQAMVDASYQVFVDHVARARGLSTQDVRATEAAVYVADDALRARLADGIATFAETLDRLETSLKGASVQVPGASALQSQHPVAGTAATHPAKEIAMTDTPKPAATSQPDPAHSQPTAAAVEQARAEGHAEGRRAERIRISAIVGSDEAKGRATMASHLAFETEMSADDAKKLLAKSPVEAAAAGASSFAAAMASLGNPKVGSGAPESGEDADTIARRIAGVAPTQPVNA